MILWLIGEPNVGKTTCARSLGRAVSTDEFVRRVLPEHLPDARQLVKHNPRSLRAVLRRLVNRRKAGEIAPLLFRWVCSQEEEGRCIMVEGFMPTAIILAFRALCRKNNVRFWLAQRKD
jgi:hypothetical protein